jgi:tetratricopeptide (TPR) repeat protein
MVALSRLDEADDHYRQAREIYRAEGRMAGDAWLHYYFAGLCAARGDLPGAERTMLAGVRANRDRGDLRGLAWLAITLSRLYTHQRRWQEAIRWCVEAMHVAQHMALTPFELEVQDELGALRTRRDPQRQRPMYAWPF